MNPDMKIRRKNMAPMFLQGAQHTLPQGQKKPAAYLGTTVQEGSHRHSVAPPKMDKQGPQNRPDCLFRHKVA